MSKAKIDIGTEVSAALIKEGVKTQGLHNSIVNQLRTLEGRDSVTIEKSFVEAIARYVASNDLKEFSLDNLNAVMDQEKVYRPVSSQATGVGLREQIEKELAANFYDVSKEYGTSYRSIEDAKSEDAKLYQTLVPGIAKRIIDAGTSIVDRTALQGLVTDLTGVNIGEGVIILASKKSDVSSSKVELNSTKRFHLMAQETARRALAPGITDPDRIQKLADTIIEAGSGFKKLGGDLFRDFQFAVRSDIGVSETPIKMLHELPEIKEIAQKMADNKDFAPAKNELRSVLNADKEKYIFGRKEIAKESVKLVVNRAVDASVAQLAEVSNDPYLKAAATELKSKMTHDVSDSFSKKVKSELIEEFMKSHISTRATAEGNQMTIKDLAARLAHPVGKGLLEAAISSALLDRKQTLETVSKGLLNQIYDGWTALKAKAGRGAASALEATGMEVSTEVLELLKGKEVGAVAVANKALEAFTAFDPDDKTTYPAADKIKVDTNKEMADRTEKFAQASKAVDLMVTTEMRENRHQPKFSLHPRVRERLVRYLCENENKDLDQVSFCKSLCNSFMARGRANKTFTLAHFEPKGDRTQGTFKEYARKFLQKIKKFLKNTRLGRWLPELPYLFTPSTAAFENVLSGVKKIVDTGITPLRLYTSHRDAQVAVRDAIAMFNRNNLSGGMILVDGKSLPLIAIDKDVRAALVKQVTIELEKARIEGKKILLDHVVHSLQPGMKELAQKGQDPITHEITAKTVKDSALSAGVVPGYMKPNISTPQSLEDFCKGVVTHESDSVLGKFSIQGIGMTRAEVRAAVLKDAMAGHEGKPGKADVEKQLKKALDAALTAYDEETGQGIYTKKLVDTLKKVASSGVEEVEVPSKKESELPTYKLVTNDSIETLSAKAIGEAVVYKDLITNFEQKQKQKALAFVEQNREAVHPAVVTDSEGVQYNIPVYSEATKKAEKLLPTLNNAKAFLEHIVHYSKSDPEYCKQLINDPKYAEILHYSRFSDNEGAKQLGNFLRDNGLADTAIVTAIEAQQKDLAAVLTASPTADIKQVAANINILKRADMFDTQNAAGIMRALLAGNALVVEGVATKPVILVGPDLMVRGKAEELLRFLHNHEDKDTTTLKTLTADFVKNKKITSQDIRDSKVNGTPLSDYIKANQGLDVSMIKVEAVQERGAHLSGVLEGKLAKSKAVAEQQRSEAQQQSGWLSKAAKMVRKVPLGSLVVGNDPTLNTRPDRTPGQNSGGRIQGK